MLFNSFAFAVFLPIVFWIYWKIPHKCRWILLLAASYYFYMSWNIKYVLLIFLTTFVSYLCAIWMEKTNSNRMKKGILILALLVCLGVLFVFKYFNFTILCIEEILSVFSIPVHSTTLNLLLPVGISFYTFQTLSYVIDVYRGDCQAEKHFGYYATFISFFPQLVAGPIERASNLLLQIKAEHKFNYERITYGLKKMAWGYYKKIIVADTLAVYVDKIYGNVYEYQGLSLVIATVFFAIQIYCDFSGYSDIAMGTAKVLDIDLMENFKSPYFSASVKEFWSRWHISLSTWFRDYIYIPLGGNRCSKFRQSLNLLITFLASGLWHGANGTYVLWGGVHGIARCLEARLDKNKTNARQFTFGWYFRVMLVFLFCAATWVFFRANTVSQAFYIFAHILKGIKNPVTYIKAGYVDMGITRFVFMRLLSVILILSIFDLYNLKRDVISKITSLSQGKRWFIYGVFVNICIVYYFLYGTDASSFIYFQF